MKKINKISSKVNKTFCLILIMVLSISSVFAQEALPDAPIDEPTAPIDDYIWVLALVALFFVFMKFRAIQKNRIQD